jgi:hypothetical protein
MIHSIVCALALSWWGILNGQVRRSPEDAGGQTVPVEAGEAGTVPIRTLPRIILDDTLHQDLALDSLQLRLLQLEITMADQKMSETSFWRRILPQIHFSASFGVHDLVFIDPASFTPYILPRDAYRLTASLSLNDVLMSPSHSQAALELERLRGILALRTMQYARSRKINEQQLAAIQDDLKSLEKEEAIAQDLLRFNHMRFEQGKIEFDALARTKLELLSIQRSIHRLQLQQSEIRLKLSGE